MTGPPHSTASRQNLHEAKRQKEPVRAASTANVTIGSPGAAIDGVTLASGNRVLLKDQTTASQNGPYIWHTASSAMTRATDASASTDMLSGDQVYVQEGTVNGATFWYLSTSAAITLGTTSLAYTRVAAVDPNQSANTVKAGPTSGGAAAPTYRALVAADLPAIAESGVTGLVTDLATLTSGKVDKSTLTTKGDLYAATASATPARQAVGSDGQVLTADSTQTTGVRWATPSGGGTAIHMRARRTTTQSIPTATQTAVQFTTNDVDTDNQHFTSSLALTGTVAKTSGSASVVGTGSAFTTELSVGQVISVPGTAAEVRVVTVITDDTHLTVNSNFANSASGQTATRVNSALVFRTAGFYWIQCGLNLDSAAWIAEIRLNGGSTILGECVPGGATTGLQVVAAYQASQWDYVEATLFQSSGGALNVNGNQRTYLACGLS